MVRGAKCATLIIGKQETIQCVILGYDTNCYILNRSKQNQTTENLDIMHAIIMNKILYHIPYVMKDQRIKFFQMRVSLLINVLVLMDWCFFFLPLLFKGMQDEIETQTKDEHLLQFAYTYLKIKRHFLAKFFFFFFFSPSLELEYDSDTI